MCNASENFVFLLNFLREMQEFDIIQNFSKFRD